MIFIKKLQRIGLYIFFFSINFEMFLPFKQIDSLSVSKIAAGIYFLTIIPNLKDFFRIDGIKQFLIPVFLFFGLFSIMNLININIVSSKFFELSFLLNILFFWIMVNNERKDYMVLEKAMFSYAWGSVALTIFFLAGIGVEYQSGRLSMFEEDQNYIGFKTVVGVIVLILAVLQNRLKLGWYRYFFFIPIPFMLNLISETGSRGAFFSFALAFAIGIILYRTKDVGRKIIALLIGLVMFIILGAYVLESEVMQERLKETVSTGETGGRAEIWKTVIQIVKKNPILGIGRTGYDLQTTYIYGEVQSPHNVLLEILCYTGFIGLIIYLSFLYFVGISSLIVYKRTSLLLPILLLIPIMGMIMSIQILFNKIGWIIFAYIISTLAIKRDSEFLLKN